jgi:hypothetical protein
MNPLIFKGYFSSNIPRLVPVCHRDDDGQYPDEPISMFIATAK